MLATVSDRATKDGLFGWNLDPLAPSRQGCWPVTREQKLALIVGFALVLVVGILISDHLSPASLDEPIESLAFGSPIGDLPPAVVIDDRSIRRSNDWDQTPRVNRPTHPPAGTPEEAPEKPAPDDDFEPINISQGQPFGISDDDTIESEKPEPKKDWSQPPQPKQSFTRYVVKKNESLSKIADRFLGSPTRWPELAALNSDRVGKDGSVREGTTLRIPATSDSTQPASTRKSDTPAGSPKTYTVKDGDTLSEIAQTYLGTVKRADEILKLNKIDDADEIFAGRVLRLPPR